jgi:hypothetical protein
MGGAETRPTLFVPLPALTLHVWRSVSPEIAR